MALHSSEPSAGFSLPLRRRPAVSRVSRRTGAGNPVRSTHPRLSRPGHRLRRIRRRSRKCAARLDRACRRCRGARKGRAESAALRGAPTGGQRRHHLHRNRSRRTAPVAGSREVEPRPWRLDALPLLVSAADWEVLEAGLVQRSRVLNAVLADLYGSRRSLTDGVLPPELLFAHPGYVRAATGIEVPGNHQLFMHACDVSRLPDGSFQVNADWTQAPSGAGYALADRRVAAHAMPDLYENVAPRPTTPFAQALRLALIDAAPDGVQDPVVVVLSPGIYSETAFDQAYLATLLGFPLVESAGSGSARGQGVDALVGHAQTCRRGIPPGRRGVRGPTGSPCRFKAGRRRFGGGATPRNGDRGQHAR